MFQSMLETLCHMHEIESDHVHELHCQTYDNMSAIRLWLRSSVTFSGCIGMHSAAVC
jgi:hypothetical protein